MQEQGRFAWHLVPQVAQTLRELSRWRSEHLAVEDSRFELAVEHLAEAKRLLNRIASDSERPEPIHRVSAGK